MRKQIKQQMCQLSSTQLYNMQHNYCYSVIIKIITSLVALNLCIYSGPIPAHVDSFFLGRTVSIFLFSKHDYKSIMHVWNYLCVYSAERITSVHCSCWAGQTTNESQGWVNNQLPLPALSVTTKPADLFHLFTLE